MKQLTLKLILAGMAAACLMMLAVTNETKADGTVTVDDFSYYISGQTATITQYTGSKAKITIADTVRLNGKTYTITGIGAYAFANNSDITSVTIPDTVTSIGDSAFRDCTNLVTVSRYGKKEVYAFIGDSYSRGQINGSDNPSRSWVRYAANKLGTFSYYWTGRGQVGVVAGKPEYYGDSDLSFSGLLYETGAPQYDVTQVVIMGGYNDAYTDHDVTELYIQRLCESARTLYPNAVISIGMCSCSTNTYYMNRLNSVADAYRECERYGCSYINGIEDILKSNMSTYMSSDGVHPTAEGQYVLGMAVADYLTEVVDLPSGLSVIGSNAFAGCASVKRVVYNSSVSVGSGAFVGCSIPSYSSAVRSTVNGWREIGDTGLYYFDNDEPASYLTDIVEYGDKQIYMRNGYKANDYTGIAPCSRGGWWRVVNGEVDFNCNSVEANEYGWWYVRDGQVDFSYTGIAPNQYGWWRIVNGGVDFGCNSVEANEYGWWYCLGGKVQFDYTGIAPNEYGWWRIVDGHVDFDCNSVEANEYGWWYCFGGKVQFDYTGIAPNQFGWWYIENGCVNFGFNGIAANDYGWWYIENGGINFDYTGPVNIGGTNFWVAGGYVLT